MLKLTFKTVLSLRIPALEVKTKLPPLRVIAVLLIVPPLNW